MNDLEATDKPQALKPRTLFEKVWQQHVVAEPAGEPTLLYIDLQLIHEVTSPQAFDGLRLAGRTLRNPARHIATVDHNVPTTSAQDRLVIADQVSAAQVNALRKNCQEFGIEFFDVQDRSQGIVHMIGPELGATKPGMTIVCGDSHTSTHGAFGALAFGIGTSEVEHVMATQTLKAPKPRTFRINVEGAPAGTSQPEGALPYGVTAKDIILEIIGQIGTDGATGYAIEYAGSAIRALSMEGRMTVCNMSIEAGARAGMIAPDDTTFAYLKGRRFSPGTQPASPSDDSAWSSRSNTSLSFRSNTSLSFRSNTSLSPRSVAPLSFRSEAEEFAFQTTIPPGAPSSPTASSSVKVGSTTHEPASSTHPTHGVAPAAAPTQWSGPDEAGNQTPTLDEAAWTLAVQQWRALVTDEGAIFDRELTIDATTLAPRVTWGTSPGMVTSIEGRVPTVDDALSDADRKSFERAFDYMGLTPGTPMEQVKVDAVFLGSCTNGRIEDLRAAARVVRGHHIATTVRAMVVPGSQVVKRQAEDEGLDQVFLSAGFEWREPGCSMCLGMNPDILQPGERCASTSNRNFEGRQGRGGRTHLLSPEMAAAAAITGHLTDVRKWQFEEATGPASLKPEADFHLDLTAGGSL